jgi:PAS domain-containing protein
MFSSENLPTADADAVVGCFYEAALHPHRWRDGLAGLMCLAGASSAVSMRADARGLHARMTDHVGLEPAAVAAYHQHYYQLDPHLQMAPHAPVATWLNDWRLFGMRGFGQSEWYNDFLRKHDAHTVLACLPVRDESRMSSISLQRPVGRSAFNEHEERQLTQLLPHLRRASLLHFATADLRERADLASAVLEHVSGPVWVLDEAGRVLIANAAAERDASLPLHVRHGVLQPRVQSARWRMALRRATAAGQARAEWLLFPGGAHGPLPALVAPLAPQAPLARQFQKPMAVVLLKAQPGGGPAFDQDPLLVCTASRQRRCVWCASWVRGVR